MRAPLNETKSVPDLNRNRDRKQDFHRIVYQQHVLVVDNLKVDSFVNPHPREASGVCLRLEQQSRVTTVSFLHLLLFKRNRNVSQIPMTCLYSYLLLSVCLQKVSRLVSQCLEPFIQAPCWFNTALFGFSQLRIMVSPHSRVNSAEPPRTKLFSTNNVGFCFVTMDSP